MKRGLLALAVVMILAVPAVAQVTIDSKGVTVKNDGSTVEVDATGTKVKSNEDGTTTTVETKKKQKKTADGSKVKGKKKVKVVKKGNLESRGPVDCARTDSVAVKDRSIHAKLAVHSAGSCTVRIEGSEIHGTKTALQTSGSSRVTVVATSIQSDEVGLRTSGSADVTLDGVSLAAPVALDISGKGRVTVKNSTIAGKILTTGKGKFIDGGGNTISR